MLLSSTGNVHQNQLNPSLPALHLVVFFISRGQGLETQPQPAAQQHWQQPNSFTPCHTTQWRCPLMVLASQMPLTITVHIRFSASSNTLDLGP